MKNKRILAVTCGISVITLAGLTFGLSGNLAKTGPHGLPKQEETSQSQFMAQRTQNTTAPRQAISGMPQTKEVPATEAQVVYVFLHQLSRLQKTEVGKSAQPETIERYCQDNFNLNSLETNVALQVAKEEIEKIEAIDAQAKQIIENARRSGPKFLTEGQSPPAPPSELKELQANRDRALTEAKEKLKRELGNERYSNLFGVLNLNAKKNLQTLTLKSPDRSPIGSGTTTKK